MHARRLFGLLLLGLVLGGCKKPDKDGAPDDPDDDTDVPYTVTTVPGGSFCAAGEPWRTPDYAVRHCLSPLDAAAVHPVEGERHTWSPGPSVLLNQ